MNLQRALLTSVVLSAAALLSGCATTTTTPSAPSSCAMPQRALGDGVHHGRTSDLAALRGVSMQRGGDVTASPFDPAGIPTPEPARPTHEPQVAGPTPQVPIPVTGGGVAVMPTSY